MKIESARELRDTFLGYVATTESHLAYATEVATTEVIEGVHHPGGVFNFGSSFADSAWTAAHIPAIAIARGSRLAQPAIGVSRIDGDEYRVAIRVPEQRLVKSPLIEQMVSDARGEADVQVTGTISAHSDIGYRRRQRPLQIGWSVGHFRGPSGTIGGFVNMKDKQGVYLLSCNHVLARTGRASVDDLIIQPGKSDGGRTGDGVAKLSQFLPLGPGLDNKADAALAFVQNSVAIEPTRVGSVTLAGAAGDPYDYLEALVAKYGRTTGLTRGRISAFEMRISMKYPGGSYLDLDGQLEVSGLRGQNFSQPGDSGSLVFTESNVPLAMLNGGGQYGYSYASPLTTVLGMLRATLAQ